MIKTNNKDQRIGEIIKGSSCAIYKNTIFARLMELVDMSDLKSDSYKEYRFKSDNE